MAFDPLPILYQALREEYGVVVTCRSGNAAALKQRLHLARKASTDERLKTLKFAASRDDPAKSIWVLNASGQAPHRP